MVFAASTPGSSVTWTCAQLQQPRAPLPLPRRPRLPARPQAASAGTTCSTSCSGGGASGSRQLSGRHACSAGAHVSSVFGRHTCSSRRGSRRGASLVVRADVDYYSVLGVEKNADKKAIKAAYRWRASLKYLSKQLFIILCCRFWRAPVIDAMLCTVQHASEDNTASKYGAHVLLLSSVICSSMCLESAQAGPQQQGVCLSLRSLLLTTALVHCWRQAKSAQVPPGREQGGGRGGDLQADQQRLRGPLRRPEALHL